MRHIEAFSNQPDREPWFTRQKKHEFAIYLAGEGGDCPNWQQEFIEHFINLQDDAVGLMKGFWLKNLTLINPRRSTYAASRRSEIKKQIMWEYTHLNIADAVVFYFPEESGCPMPLLEYGSCLANGKKLFVGIHEKHTKMLNIFAQTRLAKPDQNINYSLKDLIEEVQNYIEGE